MCRVARRRSREPDETGKPGQDAGEASGDQKSSITMTSNRESWTPEDRVPGLVSEYLTNGLNDHGNQEAQCDTSGHDRDTRDVHVSSLWFSPLARRVPATPQARAQRAVSRRERTVLLLWLGASLPSGVHPGPGEAKRGQEKHKAGERGELLNGNGPRERTRHVEEDPREDG